MKVLDKGNRANWTAKVCRCLPVLLLSNLIWPATAHAYVDPGSGSVIVTTVLGLIAAIGYTFRKYFYKAKRTLFKSKAEDNQDGQE